MENQFSLESPTKENKVRKSKSFRLAFTPGVQIRILMPDGCNQFELRWVVHCRASKTAACENREDDVIVGVKDT